VEPPVALDLAIEFLAIDPIIAPMVVAGSLSLRHRG
jgi:hypothetical protein